MRAFCLRRPGLHGRLQKKAIALLSKRRLGTAQLLVLPYDEHEADMIIQQFSDVIPYDADAAFSRSDRVLSAAVRWLGIG